VDFSDRNVIVTGGTGALGVALVGALLEAGAACYVPFRDEAVGRSYPHRPNPRMNLVSAGSLSEETEVEALFQSVPKLWASIHLVGGFAAKPVLETDKATLMQQVELNLVTSFLCCRAAVKAMTSGGAGGRIVNVAARPALEPRTGAGMVAYTAAKAAVAALTVALAEEVKKDGILVNTVAPSIMDTPDNRKSMPKANFDAWPKVEEVAQTILFLASADNKVSRGGVIPVYGRS
jgi:NAD(P)-dependent dehydrogenase (short-subunit alcohol dehydrogenase family)